MAKIPLTKDGEKKLQEELKNLKLERPKITKAINPKRTKNAKLLANP